MSSLEGEEVICGGAKSIGRSGTAAKEGNVARLSREEVEHVAHLGRLHLTDEEAERFTTELNEIVDYFQQLQQVDTEGIIPTSHSVTVENVTRDDEPRASVPRDEMLAGGPETRDGCFVVPRIVGDAPSH